MLTPDSNIKSTKIHTTDSSKSTTDDVSETHGPSAPPNASKDFRKVLKSDEKEENKDQTSLKEEEEEGATMASIFELSKKKVLSKMKDLESIASKNASLSASVFNPNSTADLLQADALSDDEQSEILADEALASRQKFGPRVEFTQEQPDMSGIIPAFTPKLDAVANPVISVPPNSNVDTSKIQEIIDQIVNNMYILKSKEQTDTTITLKNVPLLDNVQITVTSYKAAPGELNLAFSNLTQMGKDLIDMNLNPLRSALEQKNIVVHIVTTSTEIRTPDETASQQSLRERHGQNYGQQQQQQQGNQQQG